MLPVREDVARVGLELMPSITFSRVLSAFGTVMMDSLLAATRAAAELTAWTFKGSGALSELWRVCRVRGEVGANSVGVNWEVAVEVVCAEMCMINVLDQGRAM